MPRAPRRSPTIDDVRAFALTLPRTTEGYVRGELKFRIGRLVYATCSRDGTLMGIAFPREWRPVAVDAEPEKFSLPRPSELRWNWIMVRMAALQVREMHDLVLEAWRMVVPHKVFAAYSARAAAPHSSQGAPSAASEPWASARFAAAPAPRTSAASEARASVTSAPGASAGSATRTVAVPARAASSPFRSADTAARQRPRATPQIGR